jgi:hypothetical protein
MLWRCIRSGRELLPLRSEVPGVSPSHMPLNHIEAISVAHLYFITAERKEGDESICIYCPSGKLMDKGWKIHEMKRKSMMKRRGRSEKIYYNRL